MKILIFLYVTFLSGILAGSLLMTPEEHERIKIQLQPKIEECLKELGIDEDATREIHEYGEVNDCFMRCLFEKIEIMDEKGIYKHDTAMRHAEGFVKDEELRNKFLDALDSCQDVNNADLSQGEDGECERGNLLSDCLRGIHKKFEIDD